MVAAVFVLMPLSLLARGQASGCTLYYYKKVPRHICATALAIFLCSAVSALEQTGQALLGVLVR